MRGKCREATKGDRRSQRVSCVSYDGNFLQLLNRCHKVIAELRAGSAVLMTGDNILFINLGADVERFIQLIRLFGKADVAQQHFGSLKHTGGVGICSPARFYHTRRRAVNSLKHGVNVAYIGAARRAYAALVSALPRR